jgi:hypothetical protein
MSEYNKRQYKVMIETIKEYKNQNLSLRKLIDSLEGLLNCLEEISEDWRTEFLREWGVLEDECSITVTSGQKKLSSESKNSIDNAINNLKEMILRQLEK